MKLPKFDPHMKPTVRQDWVRLHEYRRSPFWWYVGCVVRIKRIKHKDVDKIKEVCRALDEQFPQLSERK